MLYKTNDGKNIEILRSNYKDDKSYYIKVENSESLHPTIREQNGRKELIAPIQDKLTYSILF